ncbi:hypothetical protein BDQ17DRAFT_24386 [Cyathus striatus]|nr:hypothetical protein BDQ17DRAFT_24386 [Cyathus striatus]
MTTVHALQCFKIVFILFGLNSYGDPLGCSQRVSFLDKSIINAKLAFPWCSSIFHSPPMFCVEPAYSKSSGHRWLDRLWPRGLLSSQPLAVRSTEVIWLPQDEYSGTTFFDRFYIKSFPDGDPTHGMVK